MKVSWIVIVCCFILVTDEALGWVRWRWRAPRISVRVNQCDLYCRGACRNVSNYYRCSACVYGCPAVCKHVCKKRRRRRDESDNGGDTEVLHKTLTMYPHCEAPVPPCTFAAYDADKDGSVSAQEFMKTLSFLSPSDLVRLFKAIDESGNERIEENEFKAAMSALKDETLFKKCN